jgi:ATP-dependent helicase/nuclease subunit A
MSEIALSPQRRAAHTGRSVWVAASAGTGKTRVLTDRVVALLLAGSAPQRILCLTFTKAAAAEMANRINERLSRWAIAVPPDLRGELKELTGADPDDALCARARQLFARVLDAPGGFRIETIHAFCQSLLRRFPIEAGIPPHFQVMEERSAEEAMAQARVQVLTAARQGHPALAGALATVTRLVHEESFAALMQELAQNRPRLEAVMRQGHAAFVEDLRQRLGLKPGETPASILRDACQHGACDEKALKLAVEILAGGSTNDRKCADSLARWLADPAQREADFDEYCLAYFTQEGSARKNLPTKALAAANPKLVAALAAEIERLQTIRARRGTALLAEATAALLLLGVAVLRAYAAHKSARALLDYDDLVLRARDLLNQPGVAPWVLYKLDGGIDHILVDEAQDTNPEQWQVVAALAEEFFTGLGARELARTIFAVGDVNQSIFSFQRADPREFVRMREHFRTRIDAARWDAVALEESFRSAAALLKAVDHTFADARAAEGVAAEGETIRHVAARIGMAGLVELWPPVGPEAVPPLEPWDAPLSQAQAQLPQARLATAIAATIKTWLDKGENLPARGRAITAGDIMVLVRRRSGFVGALVRQLKESGVAVAGVDRMLLADQLAVEDMAALGHFLLLPEGDDLTLATVLKGPLYGLNEDQLYALAFERKGSLWSTLRRRAGEDPVFRAAAEELQSLLARADFIPPFELFTEVLNARGGRRKILARLGPEAGDPLDELLASALAYERDHGASLQGFLHWLVLGDAEVKRDLNNESGRDEVRIITVHGAKGLQAPVVFLPDTLQVPPPPSRLLWSADGLPLWRAAGGGPLADEALAEAKRRRNEEYRRLLYVALTRAEDRLYVCGWHGRQTPREGNWHALVEAGLKAAGAKPLAFDAAKVIGKDGWAGEGLQLVTPQQGNAAPDRVPREPDAVSSLPGWIHQKPPPEPAPPKPLTPSRPARAEPAARSPLGDDDGAGFRRGLLVHRLLQSLPLVASDRRDAAARRFLARPVHRLPAAEQAEIAGETLAVLAHPGFAALFGPGSEAELPVVGLIKDRAISGRIDRLVVTETEVQIVDYKTLRPVPADESQVPEAYLAQLAAYRQAIAAIYPGKTVRCALLWTEGPALMPINAATLDRYES